MFFVLLAILGLAAGVPARHVCRRGWHVAAIGLALFIVIGLLTPLYWLLSGMSEVPRNDLGHPRRVHVRNESPGRVYLVDLDARDPALLDPVEPGELTIITGRFHPKYEDQACTDDRMAIVALRSGAPLTVDEFRRPVADQADLTVLAPIGRCYPKGRNIVVWDGRTAFVDPDARPPLVDPEDRPLVFGWLTAFAVLLLGVAVDVGLRVRRLRGPGHV